MTAKEYLDKLEAVNMLTEGVRAGVISPLHIRNREIYEAYLSRVATGAGIMDCYAYCAERFSVSETTVRYIVAEMR